MSRPDLVLLHGWASNATVWEPLLEVLGKKFCLHVVEMPGCGKAQAQELSDLADLSRWLKRNTPKGAAWLAWSLGGLPALHLCAGDKTHIRTLNLVGVSPRFSRYGDWVTGIPQSVLNEFAEAAEQNADKLQRRFCALMVHPDGNHRDARRLRQQIDSAGGVCIEALLFGLRLLMQVDLRGLLKEISLPVTVFHGSEDAVVPFGCGEYMQRILPGCCLHPLEGAGHIPFFTQPQQFLTKFEHAGNY